MKKLLLITLIFSATSIYAQKSIATVKDSDELSLNVKKLNQAYVENDFIYGTNCLQMMLKLL